jgi:DNA-binding CsgD family transcriptional regulator
MTGESLVPPLIVLDGSDDALVAAIDEVRAAGWRAIPGFAPARDLASPFRKAAVCYGEITAADDAASALMLALEGFGLVVAARAPREVMDRLIGDLRHVGPVEHRRAEHEARPGLGATERAMLTLLAEGHSLGEAADRLGLSRRTADRRLAEARRQLGVERTAQAIAQARRLRLLA